MDGVAWTTPIWYASGVVATGRDRQLSYVLGYDTTTGRDGPTRLATGRAPNMNEIVLDELGATQLGVRLGDSVTVLGAPHTLVGLSTGQTSITNTIAFLAAADFTRLAPRPASYLLVGARPGVSAPTLAGRLAAALPDTTVQTRDAFFRRSASWRVDLLVRFSLSPVGQTRRGRTARLGVAVGLTVRRGCYWLCRYRRVQADRPRRSGPVGPAAIGWSSQGGEHDPGRAA